LSEIKIEPESSIKLLVIAQFWRNKMTRPVPLLIFVIIVVFPLRIFANEPSSDHRPVISPDGSIIVFMSTREEGDWELFSISIDGTGLERLTNNVGWDGYAVWAPNSRSFIFDREVNGSRGAFTYDLETRAVSQFIVMDDAQASVSGWSPKNGKVVMFIERDGKRDLYIADSDGSHLEQLTDTPDENEHDAHYSHDGNRLAYAVKFEGGSALDVMDLTTGVVTRHVSSTQYLYGLDWSPDGTRIAFTDTPNDNPDGNAELYFFDLTDGEVVRLTNDEHYDHMPVWFPDGDTIIFSSYASGREEIYIFDLKEMKASKFPSGLQ
jgi:Tol biopolymer transport system component